jgi:hypothetical protein
MIHSKRTTVAFLTAVFLIMFLVSAYAGKEEVPKWRVSTQDANLGNFYEGKDIEYDFTVMNTGKGELHILSVRPG